MFNQLEKPLNVVYVYPKIDYSGKEFFVDFVISENGKLNYACQSFTDLKTAEEFFKYLKG